MVNSWWDAIHLAQRCCGESSAQCMQAKINFVLLHSLFCIDMCTSPSVNLCFFFLFLQDYTKDVMDFYKGWAHAGKELKLWSWTRLKGDVFPIQYFISTGEGMTGNVEKKRGKHAAKGLEWEFFTITIYYGYEVMWKRDNGGHGGGSNLFLCFFQALWL